MKSELLLFNCTHDAALSALPPFPPIRKGYRKQEAPASHLVVNSSTAQTHLVWRKAAKVSMVLRRLGKWVTWPLWSTLSSRALWAYERGRCQWTAVTAKNEEAQKSRPTLAAGLAHAEVRGRGGVGKVLHPKNVVPKAEWRQVSTTRAVDITILLLFKRHEGAAIQKPAFRRLSELDRARWVQPLRLYIRYQAHQSYNHDE